MSHHGTLRSPNAPDHVPRCISRAGNNTYRDCPIAAILKQILAEQASHATHSPVDTALLCPAA